MEIEREMSELDDRSNLRVKVAAQFMPLVLLYFSCYRPGTENLSKSKNCSLISIFPPDLCNTSMHMVGAGMMEY